MNLIPLIGELVAEGLKLASTAYQASKEEAAALEARLRDALATLRGAKTQAHQEIEARTKALQDELDALRKA